MSYVPSLKQTFVPDVEDRGGDSQLADSLARIIQETDPAIAGVGTAERPLLSPRSSSSSLSGAILHGPGQPRLMVQTGSNEHSSRVHYQHKPQHPLSPRSPITGQHDLQCEI